MKNPSSAASHPLLHPKLCTHSPPHRRSLPPIRPPPYLRSCAAVGSSGAALCAALLAGGVISRRGRARRGGRARARGTRGRRAAQGRRLEAAGLLPEGGDDGAGDSSTPGGECVGVEGSGRSCLRPVVCAPVQVLC